MTRRRGDRRGLPDTATGMAEGLGALLSGIKWLVGCVLVLSLILVVLLIIIFVRVT